MNYRECRKIDVSKMYKKEGIEVSDNVELYIDLKNSDSIMKAIGEIGKKKFKKILVQIFSNEYNNNLYGKEEVSSKAKNITAIKKKGKGKSKNIRIYCKEFFIDNKKIVMITQYEKKTQKVDKKLKTKLETIGGYNYDFRQNK